MTTRHQQADARTEKTVLPSGIRIVTETIDAVRSISTGLWVNNGSRDEEPADSGMSHFVEHMVFKGTKKRRTYQIAQRLESVGGYLNAYTAKENTCYYARGLEEHLDRAIDTITDLVVRPLIPEKEVEKEKEVVIEEMKMYDDTPEELIFDLFDGKLFEGHELGRPVIGYEETVRTFDRDRTMRFIDRCYSPDRIVLAVAGSATHDEVVRKAEGYFTDMDRAKNPVRRNPAPATPVSHVVEEKPIQQAHLVIGRRGYGITHPKRTVLSVLNTILGAGMSSRLNQNIRERYGFCYNIYSFVNMYSDTGDVGVYMGTDGSKIDRARKLIQRELDRLMQEPITPRLLTQAKSQVKGSILLGLESMSNRMMRIGRQELQFERFYTLDETVAELEAVTSEDVLETARELFGAEELSSVVLLPK